ncbi:MAG: DedA family protein [Planctomycetota bacterium]
MDWLKHLIDLVLHLEHHLGDLINYFGPWTYVVLFAIIFAETGLVVMPFLPGDSLLFALGALAASQKLDLFWLLALLSIAAILGDTINYWFGSLLGPRIFRGENVRFLNRKHLDYTHEFFERYGGKTIILARFMPIVRTFAPFVAGMGKMTYRRFMVYNVVGGLVWIFLFLIGGYCFGNLPMVKKNFTLVILGIIAVSLIPPVIEFIRERRKAIAARQISG